MFNILLDDYPTEWNGYALNTDFRTGVQIVMASADEELSNAERTVIAVNLLFKEAYPQDADEIEECIKWFMNGWSHDNHKSSSHENVMDFDQDQGRIYSAFLSQYRIDLNNADMHFWRFMYLLSNLEECAFTRVIDIRTKKITGKMSKQEQTAYTDAKKVYKIRHESDNIDKQAEDEAMEEFRKYL